LTDTEITESKRLKITRQVQALLSKADSTDFDAERDSILAKVDQLMLAYAIEEWELDQHKNKDQRTKPEKRTVLVCAAMPGKGGKHFEQNYVDLSAAVARHCRCKIVYTGASHQYMDTVANVFAFPADLDYFETLFVSLQVQLARQREPRPDTGQTWVENLVMLKEVGHKWVRIHELLSRDCTDYPHRGSEWVRPIGVKFTKVYSEYCKQHARDQLKTSPMVYQKNFFEGYVLEIAQRFASMRQTEPYKGTTDLVIRERTEEIDELVHEAYPKLGTLARSKAGKFDGNAFNGGRKAGANADLSGGQRGMKGSQRELA
jgi:hypothetical protein